MTNMRLKKIDTKVCEVLVGIDTNISEAIRKLLTALKNEAEKMYNEDLVKNHTDMIAKNSEELSSIPVKREEYWNSLTYELEHNLQSLELSKKILQLKIMKHKIINPTYDYETDEAWEGILLSDAKLALENTNKKYTALMLQKKNFEQDKRDSDPYKEKERTLLAQNQRLHKEIKRAKDIVAIHNKLDVSK